LSNIEAQSIVDQVREVEGISVLTEQVKVSNMGQLRSMMDEMRQEIASGIILLVAENDGKVQIVAAVSEDLIKKGYHAGNLIKKVAQICGGGGGGRPNMAQAGGTQPEKIKDALEYVESYIKNISVS